MSLLAALGWLLALAPMTALIVFTAEVLAGLAPLRRLPAENSTATAAILIPAHNEALGIADTITALRAVAPPATRLVVIADNCADDTAARARAAGATVIERCDPAHRGKGFALAFGRDWLARDPPDAVLVVDADCRLRPGSVERLISAALVSGAPAQAANLIEPVRDAPPMVQISSFAMLIKNLVRARGMSRLGGSALLTGTGMAFPWPLFARAELATGDLVEDLGLGIALTLQGVRPRLVEQAMVTSQPPALADSLGQRTRWEHGFLSTARRHALPTLLSGFARGSRARIALGAHLLVPPLALLIALTVGAIAVLALLAALGGSWTPVLTLAALLVVALAAVALAWYREGRETLTFGALLRAPLYILWKIPLYLRFLVKPERGWTRTKRQGE